MNLLHLSDIHFRCQYAVADAGYESVLYRMQNPLHMLRTCVQSLSQQVVDVVAISGDLCDHGTLDDYQQFRNAIETYFPDTPIIACPGNHDVVQNFELGFLKRTPVHHGSNVLELDELVIIALDNTNGDANGKIGPSQVIWLEKQFEKYVHKPMLLMMHHHIFEEQATIPPVVYDEEFVNLLKRYPLVGIVCGHTHYPYQQHFHETPYFTAPGLSFCGEDGEDGLVKFVERFGYQLYEYEDGMMQCSCIKVFDDGKVLNTIRF